ncbi:DLW-39 family protein [Nocardia alni]|nr:DLW-39 family protein [Nocardia alni]
MKILLTLGVVVGVIFAINKFRQRPSADLWHEVTTR